MVSLVTTLDVSVISFSWRSTFKTDVYVLEALLGELWADMHYLFIMFSLVYNNQKIVFCLPKNETFDIYMGTGPSC